MIKVAGTVVMLVFLGGCCSTCTKRAKQAAAEPRLDDPVVQKASYRTDGAREKGTAGVSGRTSKATGPSPDFEYDSSLNRKGYSGGWAVWRSLKFSR